MRGSWAGGLLPVAPKPAVLQSTSISVRPVLLVFKCPSPCWGGGGGLSPPAPMISSGAPPTTPLFGGMGEVDGGTSRVSCPGETDTSHPLSQAPRGSLMTFCVNSAAQPTAPPPAPPANNDAPGVQPGGSLPASSHPGRNGPSSGIALSHWSQLA